MRPCNDMKLSLPNSKVHGANMGPTWVLPAPGGPRVGPLNLAIRIYANFQSRYYLNTHSTHPICQQLRHRRMRVQSTVWCPYNTVNFLQNPHKRHSIAHRWGWNLGFLLWVQTLVYVLPWSLYLRLKYDFIGSRYNDNWLFVLFCNFIVTVIRIISCYIWTFYKETDCIKFNQPMTSWIVIPLINFWVQDLAV